MHLSKYKILIKMEIENRLRRARNDKIVEFKLKFTFKMKVKKEFQNLSLKLKFEIKVRN